ncbi:MAG: hypothetical protein ABI211_10750 [Vicinamibacterales bacterium]
MRRFALAIIVALLSLSASGASALAVGEPCTGYEQSGREDGTCPPTCVLCGCCAQAAEPVVLLATSAPDVHVTAIPTPVPVPLHASPRSILHVPKARVA